MQSRVAILVFCFRLRVLVIHMKAQNACTFACISAPPTPARLTARHQRVSGLTSSNRILSANCHSDERVGNVSSTETQGCAWMEMTSGRWTSRWSSSGITNGMKKMIKRMPQWRKDKFPTGLANGIPVIYASGGVGCFTSSAEDCLPDDLFGAEPLPKILDMHGTRCAATECRA